ncbi:MAG: penicillin acylase family protein [Deltaproteobacteria bacterium]|nr:penicillin acylase family protein [Deltaproteobacteria bacterium]
MKKTLLLLALAPLFATSLAGCSKVSFKALEPEEEILLPGIAHEVEVLRDEWGIPHIYCREDLECVTAQGYIQARDRFFEMDLFRNYGKGTLGVLFGANPAVRSVDRETRRVMTHPSDGRHVAEHIVESLDADLLAYLEAYAAGVNAYLDEMGSARAPVPGEYDFGLVLDGAEEPADWAPVDTVAIGRLFSMMLSAQLDVELGGAAMAAGLDAQTFADLAPSAPLDPTFALPGYYGSGALGSKWRPDAALLQRLRQAAPAIQAALDAREGPEYLHRFFGAEPGSNNWIVSAEHTAEGRVIVADDPHLPLWSPSVWHEVHIDATSLPKAKGEMNLRGVAFPGTPGIMIGHNQQIAWSVTTMGYDVSDLYQETVTGVDTVRFQGSDVAVQKVTVRFPRGPLDGDGFDEEKLCIVPHHGPLWSSEGFSAQELADPDQPCVDPSRGATAISGRWTGMEVSNEIGAALGIMKAGNVAEAKTAWLDFEVGAQNLLIGDIDGEVAYFPYARVPIRDGDLSASPPWLPMPGEGTHEWKGDIPVDELPQADNPASGFLVTANNDIVGTTADGNPVNDAHYLYYTRDLGLRAGRITRLLEEALAEGPVTLERMREIQTDTKSDLAAALLPHLLDAAGARADLVTSLGIGDALARLTAWDYSQPTGLSDHDTDAAPSSDAAEREAAIASSLFSSWLFQAIEATFRDELSAAGAAVAGRAGRADQAMHKAFFFALEEDRNHYFDNVNSAGTVETREEILLQALADAVTELQGRLGNDPEEWLWGRIHRAHLQSIFGVFGVPNAFDLGPVPEPGGLHTINVAGFNRDYTSTHGPSLRMFTVMDPEGPRSEQIIPGGTIDELDHPNHGDQLVPWLEGRYKVIATDPEAVLEAAEARQAAGITPGGRWLFSPQE